MSHVPIHVSTLAAAERLRQEQELEELQMTKYTPEDLNDNWEFKIVRSTWGAFRKPEVLQRVLEEETLAGWELLEKFDDYRIRLKRAKDARRRDDRLPPGVDPYRTQIGTSAKANEALVAVSVGLGMLLLLGGVALALPIMRSAPAGASNGSSPFILIAGVVIFVLLLVVGTAVMVIRRRQ